MSDTTPPSTRTKEIAPQAATWVINHVKFPTFQDHDKISAQMEQFIEQAIHSAVEDLEIRHAAVMLHTQAVVDENVSLRLKVERKDIALKKLHDFISAFPINAFGSGGNEELGEWPIRDEILHNITVAMSSTQESK